LTRIPELFEQVRAGAEVTIWENGVMIARLMPADPILELALKPDITAAEAFAGRIGGISREGIPTDLATQDEAYCAEIMAAKHQSETV
jgi:antitoxin (DNA-binding transcriptional repressor) of toxin-antitoxin stability system